MNETQKQLCEETIKGLESLESKLNQWKNDNAES